LAAGRPRPWIRRDIGSSGVLPIEPGADYGVGHAMGDFRPQPQVPELPNAERRVVAP
jgi:hypothetical protein